MQRFDLLGPLPARRSTTVLQASAGTGKTFALAGLVTRYIAEGEATLDQMLLITFSRAASQELRERVRAQIVQAVRAFDDSAVAGDNQLVQHLIEGSDAEREERKRRLRDAQAGFDAATIATTHQFCQLVLRSLGVAGDTAASTTLLESLDELVAEIVDDLYLAHFGQERDDPVLSYPDALRVAREVVNNPSTELRPHDAEPGSPAAVRVDFAKAVLAELDTRKRRLGVLSYDDLLIRLADALDADDSPARMRMHQRWPIVMVDEFQDTDPVQWRVIDRAFSGCCTVILIGDPKQAIYAFRGGDIVTYLQAADSAGERMTLATNWRTDSALVDRLQVVLRGAQLGDAAIVVDEVEAHHRGHRLAGAPHNDPFRLRVVRRATLGRSGTANLPIDELRAHIGADLAADIGALLASDATFDGKPLQARDIAVIVEKHRDGAACFNALCDAGIPAVYTGESDVFGSDAAADWLCLLEAFDQPHRPGMVRAAAATMFFGETAESLAAGGDELTDRVAETLREWAGHARERGVAAIFEAAQLRGMGDRLLSVHGGERHMTDLAHITQLLQEEAHREHYSLPALRDWLRRQRDERSGATERNRRLDSDAAAVQVMTVYVSKGLQFPIVYLPFAFNRNVQERDVVLFHDENDQRCLYIGGKDGPNFRAVQAQGRAEDASDDSRLTYVAMTRAQSQVVAWWSPARDEPNGGLSRLLRGRRPREAVVPDVVVPAKISDDDAMARLREWEAAGGPVLEDSVVAAPRAVPPQPVPTDLESRHFHRTIDTEWRRTSYSGLIRVAETSSAASAASAGSGVSSEPETTELDDEAAEILLPDAASKPDLPSPMADLPTGAKFGTLVHAVLETADPLAADLATELESQIRQHSVWWPVDVAPEVLAAAMVPMHDTPLGPLADGLTLRQIGLRDRLRELDFELPLAGGDLSSVAVDGHLADVGRLLREHLPADDAMAPYADRLTGRALGDQSLRGYLTGSIDAVLRVRDGSGHRYLVVDYKTNWLGDPQRALSAADYNRSRLVEAMLHSDYPLQALLYSAVLHRFLRWRVTDYDPDRHLGGVLYLFVRGMCGADTPMVDGHPCGVFSWQPPPALIVALSDLLDAGRVAA
ncbi:exodeoxyribonuclease V subunit beta [Mycobacterium conspicuum]|jgi:exodeoxyribonuclease V beta subunit|uniref:RecBCD enzyme subunit RecB n=1 Tax=Mycobacterium conspicuum TaxID=44010 RepID=A0A1X1T9X7_9MYCO|nr:exodeoxyribonuclease V subunit beta [Mycobacterium conspicuum]ORV41391.1 exodeoxyribonuclease V subunit beta [Mycobacterium conspicuum]BBZ37455.1 RecBCD enzyme subunit RecB [Mycobacterium conspicuum]